MKLPHSLLLSVIVGFIFSIPTAPLQAAQAGTTAYTKDRILLRVEPKPTARFTATLEAGVQVRVNHCAEGWCSVTVKGLTGYVLEKFLVRKIFRPPAKQGRPDENPQRTSSLEASSNLLNLLGGLPSCWKQKTLPQVA